MHCIENSRKFFSSDVKILPQKFKLKAIAVEFENLDKIRSPVGICEGFDISEFDKVILVRDCDLFNNKIFFEILVFIKNASKLADGFTEPHPLWEYPAYPLSDINEIYSIDTTLAENLEKKAEVINNKIKLTNPGTLNAVVIWHEIIYENDETINTGIIEKPVAKKHIKWSMKYKQGVHLLDRKYKIDEGTAYINYTINSDLKNGIFDCKFNVEVIN